MGCCPPAKSIMLSRRIPSASPGARASLTRKPSSSGPRWNIARAIVRTRASASELRVTKATPQIPHTLLFDLRCSEKCGTSAREMFAQVKTGNPQSAVQIPGHRFPQHQEKKRSRDKHAQSEERFALEQQTPIQKFIPSRIDLVEDTPQSKRL